MNFKKISLLIACIFVYLVLLDLAFYVMEKPPSLSLSYDIEEWQEGVNLPGEDDGFVMNANSHGLRDEEVTFEKTEDEYRIIILGDSFTYGYGELENESYPSLLEEKLKVLNPNINVLNFGGNGHDPFLQLLTLKKKVPKYNPDLILLGYFLNDADISDTSWAVDYCENLYSDKGDGYYPFKMLHDYFKKSQLIITSEGVDEYLLTLYGDEQLGWWCTKQILPLFAEEEVVVFILPFFDMSSRYDEVFSKIETAMNAAGIENYNMHVDMYEIIDPELNISYFNSYNHYNLMSNSIVADYMYDVLQYKVSK